MKLDVLSRVEEELHVMCDRLCIPLGIHERKMQSLGAMLGMAVKADGIPVGRCWLEAQEKGLADECRILLEHVRGGMTDAAGELGAVWCYLRVLCAVDFVKGLRAGKIPLAVAGDAEAVMSWLLGEFWEMRREAWLREHVDLWLVQLGLGGD